jgi:uncharacterized protein with beta-barrel porin domain
MDICKRRQPAGGGFRPACARWVAFVALLASACWVSAASLPPGIRLATPVDGDHYYTHADIELTADVPAEYAPYVRVEYFANGRSLGETAAAPRFRVVWRDAAAGAFTIRARLRFDDYYADSDPVGIEVRDRIIHPVLAADAPTLEFTPGVEIALPIAAVDEAGVAVAQAALAWRVETISSLRSKAACVDADMPAGGPLVTGADGKATLRFVPGCASSNRRILITAAGTTSALDLTLRGPDDRAGAVTLTSGAAVLVLPASTPTPVSFTVQDVRDAPLAGSTLVFALVPPAAGTIDPAARVDDGGLAATQLTLAAGTTAATLSACVRGRSGLCVQIPLRSTDGAIADPAAAILGAVAQQALDTPLAQFNNIGNHLRSLRNGGGGFSNDISVRTGDGSIPAGSGEKKDSRFSVFVAGSVDLGKRDSRRGAHDGFDATTRGLTLGADLRVSPAVVLGAAFGGMRSRSDVADGGRQHARGTSTSLYAQWLPSEHAYLNAALNFGSVDFDIARPGCGADLRAETSSDHRALSVEGGYSFNRNALRFTPYLRYQHVHASLDALVEQGVCLDALSIDATSLGRSSVVAGASLDRAFSTRSGVWIPSLGFEYLRESEHQDATFARLQAGGPSIPVHLAATDRRYGIVRFSLSWMTSVRAQPLSAFVGFDTDIGRSDYDSRTFMLGLRVPF